MTYILGIAWLLLIGINWLIYHKIFNVFYFGSVSKGLSKELVTCGFVAMIELAVIMALGQWLLAILIPIAVVVGIIILIFAIIGKISKLKKEKSFSEGKKMESAHTTTVKPPEPNPEQTSESEPVYVTESIDIENENDVNLDPYQSTANIGSELDGYILQNFSIDTKLQAISYYREQTGLGLKESKEKVEALFAQGVMLSKKEPEVINDTIFCTGCGKKIVRTAKFCNFCGIKNTYKRKVNAG